MKGNMKNLDQSLKNWKLFLKTSRAQLTGTRSKNISRPRNHSEGTEGLNILMQVTQLLNNRFS